MGFELISQKIAAAVVNCFLQIPRLFTRSALLPPPASHASLAFLPSVLPLPEEEVRREYRKRSIVNPKIVRVQ